jgi:hypothetical protein
MMTFLVVLLGTFFLTFLFCMHKVLNPKPSYMVGDTLQIIMKNPEVFERPIKIKITAVGKKKYQYVFWLEDFDCYAPTAQAATFFYVEATYERTAQPGLRLVSK